MNIESVSYWVCTTLIALETFVGGFIDLFHGRTGIFTGPFVADVVTGLGYPIYILVILGAWKIPGAIVLAVPGWLRLKEWAYAGIVFELSGAAISHAMVGHRSNAAAPLILLTITFCPGRLGLANVFSEAPYGKRRSP